MIAKAEHLPKGANPRFIVTSLKRKHIDARTLYRRVYCACGEMENRIKEQQLDLGACPRAGPRPRGPAAPRLRPWPPTSSASGFRRWLMS